MSEEQIEWIQTLVKEEFFSKYIMALIKVVKATNLRLPNLGKTTAYVPSESEMTLALLKEEKRRVTGKLAVIKDPECKMRVVAILDYLSQFILRPYHDQLFKLLKKFEQDRTFTQNPFHSWQGCDPFYSLDLSSATDRFPVHLQEKMICYLFGNSHPINKSKLMANAWRNLLTQREFLTPDGESTVKYSVGQPMGGYSSWAAFSLCHHFVVQFCAWKHNLYPFTNYILLGDDIVIKNTKVAKEYMKVMRRLGVEISPTKTHVSKDTYEFAKRWIRVRDNKFFELSPMPIKGIYANMHNPFIVYTVLFDYFFTKGNLCVHRESLKLSIVRLYQGLRFRIKDGRGYKNISYTRSYLTEALNSLVLSMRDSHGLLTYDELRQAFAHYSNLSSYPLGNDSTILRQQVRRALSMGVYQSVQVSIETLQNSFKKWFYFVEEFLPLNAGLVRIPLWHNINNYVNDVSEKLRELEKTSKKLFTKDNKDEIDMKNIYDLYKLVNFLDMNDIISWDRNFHSLITGIGRLWSKSLKTLNDEQEAYYNFPHVVSFDTILHKLGNMLEKFQQDRVVILARIQKFERERLENRMMNPPNRGEYQKISKQLRSLSGNKSPFPRDRASSLRRGR